jgi:quinol monooxygenase YgiN
MGPFLLIVHTAIKPGRREDFRVAAAALREISSAEPGTLRYDWYSSEDGTTEVTVEEFADSTAFIAHNDNTAAAVPALIETADITAAQVIGEVSDEARERLKGLSSVHFQFEGGL